MALPPFLSTADTLTPRQTMTITLNTLADTCQTQCVPHLSISAMRFTALRAYLSRPRAPARLILPSLPVQALTAWEYSFFVCLMVAGSELRSVSGKSL